MIGIENRPAERYQVGKGRAFDESLDAEVGGVHAEDRSGLAH